MIKMTKFLRFSIIGTGTGSNLVAKAFKPIREKKIADIVSVTSKREERAKNFAEKYSIKSWYTDYNKMFREEELDAIIICTPHYLHLPMTIDALEHGINVLVDKPMAITLKQCDEMIRRAQKAGVKLGVLFQYRFDDKIRRIKDIIDNGKLGKIILSEATVKWYRTQEYYDNSPWRGRFATEGGGVLINQAIHYIDLILWLLGEPSRLYAKVATFTHNIEVEDNALIMITFKNGSLGIVQASTSTYPGLPTRLEIHGENGTILMEGDSIKMIAIKGEEIIREEKKEGLESWARPEAVPAVNHTKLIIDFIHSILDDREPLVNGYEGRKSIEFIRAAYFSAKHNCEVSFPFEEV